MSTDRAATTIPTGDEVTYVPKACAYVIRTPNDSGDDPQLLAFEGPGHDGLQVPKGTVEPDETPREAAFREVAEESGLGALGDLAHLATDAWTRRPGRRYVRHFFRAAVHEPRDEWTHTVTGEGAEVGATFSFSWVDLPPTDDFALALDDYVHLLR